MIINLLTLVIVAEAVIQSLHKCSCNFYVRRCRSWSDVHLKIIIFSRSRSHALPVCVMFLEIQVALLKQTSGM